MQPQIGMQNGHVELLAWKLRSTPQTILQIEVEVSWFQPSAPPYRVEVEGALVVVLLVIDVSEVIVVAVEPRWAQHHRTGFVHVVPLLVFLLLLVWWLFLQHFYLLRLAVLLFIQFDFFLGLLLLIYCFLGLLLLVASDVVCFGQVEDYINEFVIIGFDLFDWLAPLAKSLIQFLQTGIFQHCFRPPTVINPRELGDQRQRFRVDLGRSGIAEERFDVIAIEQNNQQQTFVLILLKHRNAVAWPTQIAHQIAGSLEQPRQEGTLEQIEFEDAGCGAEHFGGVGAADHGGWQAGEELLLDFGAVGVGIVEARFFALELLHIVFITIMSIDRIELYWLNKQINIR